MSDATRKSNEIRTEIQLPDLAKENPCGWAEKKQSSLRRLERRNPNHRIKCKGEEKVKKEKLSLKNSTENELKNKAVTRRRYRINGPFFFS